MADGKETRLQDRAELARLFIVWPATLGGAIAQHGDNAGGVGTQGEWSLEPRAGLEQVEGPRLARDIGVRAVVPGAGARNGAAGVEQPVGLLLAALQRDDAGEAELVLDEIGLDLRVIGITRSHRKE